MQLLIEHVWTKLRALFPERQIYIRSEGRIQFFTFSTSLQATCAGLCFVFLGWIAFTSINVTFKDRIIAAREIHLHQVQGAYQNRVTNLQLSYAALNHALVSAEARFKSTVDELAAKQRRIAGLVHGRPIATSPGSLSAGTNAEGAWFESETSPSPERGIGVANDSLGPDAARPIRSPGYSPPLTSSVASHGSGSSELGIMPQPVEPQPRTARPLQAGMFGGALLDLFRTMIPRNLPLSPVRVARSSFDLSLLAQQTRRAARISRSETVLLLAFDTQLERRIGAVTGALSHAGVDGAILPSGEQRVGVQSPLVTVRDLRIEGISDSAFVSAYVDATQREAQLARLRSTLAHVPLAVPVRVNQFTFSSGFGPRMDPFSGRVAFHPGVDLAGPWGASVYATADGVVVWAGARGGYGNMVEIDHGYGFRTRYGHLSSILVRPGETVQEGTVVGKVGSTGRSTGPHLHYEVWLADSAKDPDKFLEMGRRLVE